MNTMLTPHNLNRPVREFATPVETALQADWTMRPAYMCLHVYDAVTGHIRRSSLADVAPAAQLCDSYDMSGTCPVHAQDVPAPIRQVALARACIANSRAVGKWMTVGNIDEIRGIVEMSQLAGRTPPYVILQITISPLRLNVEMLDIIWKLRARLDIPMAIDENAEADVFVSGL